MPFGTAFPLLRPLRVFPTPATQGRRLTLVTDSLNEGSLFGGVGTSIVLVSLLARRLKMHLCGSSPAAPRRTRPTSASCSDLRESRVRDRNVEFVSAPLEGHESLPLHDRDLFVTTSWWSTKMVHSPRRLYPEKVVLPRPGGRAHVLSRGRRAGGVLRDDCRQPDPVRRQHRDAQGSPCSGGFLERRPQRYPLRTSVPDATAAEARPADDQRRTFFFYARPNNDRNLFLRGPPPP